MNTHRHPLFVLASRGLSAALLLLAFAGSASAVIVAPNDPPDLSSAPPDLSQSVDPNILVTFDDSGSMASNFMGDNRPFDGSGWGGGTPENNPWFCSGVIDPRATSGVLTKSMNGVYYNPTVVYTPPLYQDGTPFPNADATLAGVVADGIAINRPAAANQQTAASATYMNNVNSDSNANDTRVAIINGKLETTPATTGTANESCGPSSSCSCSAKIAGGTVSSCSCSTDSRGRKTCNWVDTYPIAATNTDKRWSCGSASNKNSSGNNTTGPYAGVNPHYPTAMVYADGTAVADADRWGPYYYRLKSSVALTTDTFGDPDSNSQTALYTASNWEAVLVTNTNVTIGTKTINQWQNFANWYAYYRTRNLMTRSALSRVFGVLGQNIRVAWQNISPYDASTTTKSTAVAITSSTIITNLTNNNANAANYRTNFFNWIFQTPAYSATPDRAATIQAGAFFERVDAKDNSSGVPAGTAPHLTDPYYDPGVGHDLGCRQNFHMLVTDGYWNEGDPTTPTGFFTAKVGPTQTSGSTTTHNLPDGTAYSTTDTQTAVYWNTQGTSYDSSLANIGFYYWAHDLRPDLAPTATPTPYHSPVPIYVKDTKTGITTSTGATNAAVNEEIYFNPANDPANWRHVVQFMVTLGVAGNLNYSSDGDCVDPSNDFCHLRKNTANSSGAVGWPRPANNSPPAIDDTWHAAANSRGSYFSASNPANLVAHLSEIIDSIIARSGQSTAESVSTSILNQGAVGFQGGYNSSGWTGYLYKQTLNTTTGAVLSQVWDAGCYLTGSICAATGGTGTAADWDTGRTIFTSIGTPGSLTSVPFRWASLGTNEQAALSLDPKTTHPDTTTTLVPAANGTADANGDYRVRYVRGQRDYESSATPTANPTNFRPRISVLGAIINSQAVYEGAPSGRHTDTYPVGSPEQTAAASGTTYEAFVKTNLNRKPVVYAGANDGMLHAFDANSSNGAELWAYVPHALYANGQLDQLTNPTNTLVTTVDDTPILQDVFLTKDSQWHTMLVGSLRLGGRGIYALDVTDSSTPATETAAAGKFMWEFSSEQDADLGYTYGSANIARIRCNVSPCKGTGSPGGTWVVLVSGGYFPLTLPGQVNGNSATDAAGGVTKTTTYLWVLNAGDGSVIAKIPTKSGTTSYGLSTPVVVDFGLDQLDDVVVAGDLAGNLWRFDISDPNPTNWASKVDPMFETYTSTAACSSTNTHGVGCEPISVMPVAFPDAVNGSVIYVFGSGEYLGNFDKIGTNVLTPQHYFGVRDYGTGFASYPFHEADLNTQAMTQDSSGNRFLTYTPTASVNTPSRGWQIPLNITGITGERDIATASPLYSAGIAVLVSLIPGSNNDPCSPGRLGAAIAVNANTGGPPVPSSNGSLTGAVGGLVSNPPAVGGASAISVLGGGTIILPGMGVVGDPNNPPKFQNLTPIWRRTSWNELLNSF